MNIRNDKIIEWIVNKIKRNYKEAISLLVIYGSYINGTANHLSDVDFYIIPKTEKAYGLCRTFIIEGIGFDLFPMSWERVEGLAGKILMPLSDSVAYANQTYFRKGLKTQLDDLKNMREIPTNYLSLYESIIRANSSKEIHNTVTK